MKLLKGLYQDVRPQEQLDGSYSFGKNGVQYDILGTTGNEPGFKKITSCVIPYTVNGIIETDSVVIIFSTDDTNSAIGFFSPLSKGTDGSYGAYIPIFDDRVNEQNQAEFPDGFLDKCFPLQTVLADNNAFPSWLQSISVEMEGNGDSIFSITNAPTGLSIIIQATDINGNSTISILLNELDVGDYEGGLSLTNGTQYQITVTVSDPNGVIPSYEFTQNMVAGSGEFTTPTVQERNYYKLGFKKGNYITGEFQRNFAGEIICSFTDKVTFPKYLNCDNFNGNLNNPDNPVVNMYNLSDWNIFPHFQNPNITLNELEGGSLQAGTYYVAVQYQRLDGTTTPYSQVSTGIVISDTSLLGSSDSITNKSLQIQINNVDITYQFVIVTVVSSINGVVAATQLSPFALTQSGTEVFQYSGNETDTQTVDMANVLVNPAIYKTAYTMGQLNDALYMANVTTHPSPDDLQQVANKIKLQWISKLYNTINVSTEISTGEVRGLKHGETYAFYVRFRFKDGRISKAFILNGPIGNSNDLSLVDNGSATNNRVYSNYQVADTVPSSTVQNTDGTTIGNFGIWYNQGQGGTKETYPENGFFVAGTPLPDGTFSDGLDSNNQLLGGQTVRHFRTPSIRWMKENVYTDSFTATDNEGNSFSGVNYGIDCLDVLGVIASNINIPVWYQDTKDNILGVIDSVEVLYATRTIANSTNFGSGIVIKMGINNASSNIAPITAQLYTTGMNTSGGEESSNNSNTAALLVDNTFRFYAPDLLFNQPAITPDILSPQLCLWVYDNVHSPVEIPAVPSTSGTVSGVSPATVYGMSGNSTLWYGQGLDNGNQAIYLFNYTDRSQTKVQNAEVDDQYGFKMNSPIWIAQASYIPNNTDINNIINMHHESTYAGTIDATPVGGTTILPIANWWNNQWQLFDYGSSPVYPPFASWGTNNSPDTDGNLAYSMTTYLVDLIEIKGILFENFYNQPLVSMSGSVQINGQLPNIQTSPLFGGDTFIGNFSVNTYGRMNYSDDNFNTQPYYGIKSTFRFTTEAAMNLSQRFQIPGNNYSGFSPNNAIANGGNGNSFTELLDRTQDPNQIGYSKSLGALNNVLSATVYSSYQTDLTKFPYRIHRGGKLSRQTQYRSWRTFLPLDYYELQKNRGEIVNLEGMMDRLFIHCEQSLFYTQDKYTLNGSANSIPTNTTMSVTLGSGDIFKFEPQEIMPSKLGYGGTIHDLACVNTPIGYCFLDTVKGELYLLQTLKGLSLNMINPGLNRFLRKYARNIPSLLQPDEQNSVQVEIGKNVFIENGITIGYDPLFKRILFTVKRQENNEDYSFTIAYAIENNTWTYFHDYIPDFYFHTRNQLWLLKDNQIYQANKGVPGIYFDDNKIYPYFIDAVFVEKEGNLILNTVQWITEVVKNNLHTVERDNTWKTLTHISIWNSYQHTGRIAIQNVFDDLQYEYKRKLSGIWTMNSFRNMLKNLDFDSNFLMDIFNNYAVADGALDLEKDWYDKDLIEDRYIVVRFEFDNISKKQLILHDVDIDYTQSNR